MELIVVDGGSVDSTVEIARSLGAIVVEGNHSLLRARRLAAELAAAPVVVLLDSDQILAPRVLDEPINEILSGRCDMFALGERVASPRTIFQRLSDADKRLIEMNVSDHLDPDRGVILPRIFARSLLLDALAIIPTAADEFVVGLDHAMIYKAARRFSSRVEFVRSGVWHQEPESIHEVWQKNFRYGETIAELRKSRLATQLILSKSHRLGFRRGTPGLRIASVAFLAIKALPATLGACRFELRSALRFFGSGGNGVR